MDNINNTQTPEPKENNKKLIIIASIAIVVLIAAFVVAGIFLGWFGGKKESEKKTPTAPTIKVVETKGSEAKTTKVKISVRDVKFGDKLKDVKKFEEGQKDTLATPSEAKTKDGYTYLTYQFDPKKAEFYGVKPTPSASGSLLQYVFYKKKLFDIRVQYGDISSKDRSKAKKNIIDKYGKPTYSIVYSNDSTKDNWKTNEKDPKKQGVLSFNYSPNTGVIIDYMSISR